MALTVVCCGLTRRIKAGCKIDKEAQEAVSCLHVMTLRAHLVHCSHNGINLACRTQQYVSSMSLQTAMFASLHKDLKTSLPEVSCVVNIKLNCNFEQGDTACPYRPHNPARAAPLSWLTAAQLAGLALAVGLKAKANPLQPRRHLSPPADCILICRVCTSWQHQATSLPSKFTELCCKTTEAHLLGK